MASTKGGITGEMCAKSRWRCRGLIAMVLLALGGLLAGWAWGNGDKIAENTADVRANAAKIEYVEKNVEDIKQDTRYIRERLDDLAGKDR